MTDENTTNVETTQTETVEAQAQEKKFSQDEVNKLIAKEKRSWEKKFESIQNEFNTFKGEIEQEQTKREEKVKTQVGEMKKDLPPQIMKLLDKLTIQEQFDYLNDPENKIEKKTIPSTPKEKEDASPKQKKLPTLF